jgi:hypothetical protein
MATQRVSVCDTAEVVTMGNFMLCVFNHNFLLLFEKKCFISQGVCIRGRC